MPEGFDSQHPYVPVEWGSRCDASCSSAAASNQQDAVFFVREAASFTRVAGCIDSKTICLFVALVQYTLLLSWGGSVENSSALHNFSAIQ